MKYLLKALSIFFILFLALPGNRVHAQVSTCLNADFELNSFAGWSGTTSNWPVKGCCPINSPTPGIVPGRHTIMTAGTDPNTNNLLSVVAPGGLYSVRLGNDNVNSEAEQLSYTFLVTPQTQLFIYRYAVVLQDPGHLPAEQPRFEIRVFDQNGAIDSTCGYYSVFAGGGIPGFHDAIDTTSHNHAPQDTVRWKDWTAVGIDLSSKLGSTVTIEFSTGDCSLGQHYGYAYIDCMCNTFKVSNDFCPGSLNATLTAPAGFASYLWSTGATTRSINIINPLVGDSFSVVLTSVTGCAVTLTSIMRVTSIGAAFTQGDSCYNAANFLDSSYIIIGTPVSHWLWDFGDGTTSTLQNPIHTFPALGNYTVTLIAANEAGCTDTIVKQIGTRGVPSPAFSYIPECPHSATVFTDSSTDAVGTIQSWLWNFGDSSATTSTQSPVHTFNAPGIYNVALTVKDNFRCSNTITKPVGTLPSPDAGFRYTTVCSGNTVTFIDTSILFGGSTTSRTWYFGDGSPVSHAVSPAHTYASPGTYNASLVVVVNSNCSDSITLPVNLLIWPTANFTATTPCANASMTFTDSSFLSGNTITAWSWNFGDGSPLDNNKKPSHVYNQVNTFAVTLIVTASNGCTGTITKNVSTLPLPNVDFTVTGGCSGQPAQFNSLSTFPGGSITNLRWNFGDFTPSVNATNPAHTYVFPGNYNVRLVATASNGCRDTLIKPVSTPNSPQAIFTAPNGCPGLPVYFESFSVPGSGSIITTQWKFGDGSPLISGVAVSHIYQNSGTYTATLYITSSSGCTDSVSHTVNIPVLPVADFTAIPQCVGQQVGFNDATLPVPAPVLAWTWNFGDGSPVDHSKNPSHIYMNDSLFSVTLIITNTMGCIDTINKSVFIKQLPQPNFTIHNLLCAGDPVQFTDSSSSPSGIMQHNWYFGDGTFVTGSTAPAHSYILPGNYNITLTAIASNGCVDSISKPVTIMTPPTAIFSVPVGCPRAPVTFNNLSTPGTGTSTTAQWNFGDGPALLNGNTVSHTYLIGGGYNVTLYITSNSGCMDTVIHPLVLPNSPVAAIGATGACMGHPTLFNDVTLPVPSPIVTWSWNFGDGSAIDHNQVTSHIYLVDSLVPVSLIVTNADGCKDTVNKTLFIQPLPRPGFTIHNTLCAGDVILLNDSSFSPTGIPQHDWSFGDGTFASGSLAPAHTYALPGNYTIKLITTAGNGCIDSISKPVSIMTPPTANFAVPAGCPLVPVTFNNLSLPGSGTSTTAQWNFGDGTAITGGASIAHAYLTGGSYNVTLYISSNSGCTDTVIHPVVIPDLPVADISATGACLGHPTQFNDVTLPVPSPILGWSWNFGDGSPIDHNANPSHTYLVDSLIPVTLIVTNTDGCIDTVSETVFIQPLPSPGFSIHNTLCAGDVIQLNDSSFSPTGIPLHDWSFGDGTLASGSLAPAHTYALPGNYTIKLITTAGNGCIDSISKPVSIMTPPTAIFSIPVGCPGAPVTFSSLSVPGSGTSTTAQWNFGDGPSLTNGNSVAHNYLAGGTYNVTLYISSNSGCTDTVIHPVVLPDAPVANIDATGACMGQPTLMNDITLPVPVPIVAWNWNFGDGSATVTQQNTSHIYNIDSLVTLTLVVKDSNGCVDTTTKAIFIQPLPSPGFSIHNNLCAGDPVQLTDSSFSPTGITQHNWYLGDGTFLSGTSSFVHTYALPGNYDITLTAIAGNGCVDSIKHIAAIKSLPVASFAFSNVCMGQALNFTDHSSQINGTVSAWSWNFGDGGTDTLKNPVHSYNASGIKNVYLQVTGNAGCKHDTTLQALIFPLPQARFNVGNICKGNAITFIDSSVISSGSIKQWYWKFGNDPFIGSVRYPVHTFNIDSSYLTLLTVVSDSGCTDTIGKIVVVHSLPVPVITTDSVCFGQPNSFTSSTTIKADSITQLSWNFGDGNYSAASGPTHRYGTTGLHNVTLTATSNYGCVDSTTKMLRVYQLPVADLYTNDREGCQPWKVSFTDKSVSPEGTINHWSWDFGDGGSDTAKNPIYIYDGYGLFDVGLTVTTDLNCSNSIVKPDYINVHPKPVAGFSYTPPKPDLIAPTVYFHDESVWATKWTYTLGDGTTTTESDPIHLYPSMGTYHIMQAVSTPYGCRDTAYREIFVNDVFTLYIPNSFTPDNNGSNDYFSAYGTGIVDFYMKIFNRWGQPVFEAHALSDTWDGHTNNQKAPEDVYYYIAKVTDVFKKQHTLNGSVTIVR